MVEQWQLSMRLLRIILSIDSTTNETKEQTAFINGAWGKLVKQQAIFVKGSRCFVEGRLQTRSYETQDGQKRYVTEVVANFVGQSLI